MSSPLYSIVICVAYIPIVCWILPKFMQHRPAYDLRQFMMFYNFGMVLLSGYIWLEVRELVSDPTGARINVCFSDSVLVLVRCCV